MSFIKLNELYYHNGFYVGTLLTKPISINMDDIVSVREGIYNYNIRCSIIRVRGGISYPVKENHYDIMNIIEA